ncbi:hypothetical protein cyc_08470 [Cyclospora cayetanensis]|uniref:Uncharacterized protein n=1 Tax=Cyclospora cayetanensis TaxID=88456 RepID=A0A1D3CT18_9EIME|nr:hypothetical protein cyc_08470 [Cyclospora cayetanensis]
MNICVGFSHPGREDGTRHEEGAPCRGAPRTRGTFLPEKGSLLSESTATRKVMPEEVFSGATPNGGKLVAVRHSSSEDSKKRCGCLAAAAFAKSSGSCCTARSRKFEQQSMPLAATMACPQDAPQQRLQEELQPQAPEVCCWRFEPVKALGREGVIVLSAKRASVAAATVVGVEEQGEGGSCGTRAEGRRDVEGCDFAERLMCAALLPLYSSSHQEASLHRELFVKSLRHQESQVPPPGVSGRRQSCA